MAPPQVMACADEVPSATTICGELSFMAPEMLEGKVCCRILNGSY